MPYHVNGLFASLLEFNCLMKGEILLANRGRPLRKENRHVVWFPSSSLQRGTRGRRRCDSAENQIENLLRHRVMIKNTCSITENSCCS